MQRSLVDFGVPTCSRRLIGSDFHEPSIAFARKEAEQRGLKNVSFEVHAAKDLKGEFDCVVACDNLHDQGIGDGLIKRIDGG